MKYYLEYADFSLLQAFVCEVLRIDLALVLENSNWPVSRYRLEKWQDLEAILGGSNFFFEENADQNLLIDIGQVEVNAKSVEFIQGLDFGSKNVFIYCGEDKSLTLDQKKLLKKTDVDYQNLKTLDVDLALNLAKNYDKKINLDVAETNLKKLIKQSKSYQEIIDTLDLIELSGDTLKALKSILIEEELPLFMYGFSTANLEKDTHRWFAKITEENVQLILSVIYGKLDKQNSQIATTIQKKIILTDKNIKTSTKLTSVVWTKLFLWQAKTSL